MIFHLLARMLFCACVAQPVQKQLNDCAVVTNIFPYLETKLYLCTQLPYFPRKLLSPSLYYIVDIFFNGVMQLQIPRALISGLDKDHTTSSLLLQDGSKKEPDTMPKHSTTGNPSSQMSFPCVYISSQLMQQSKYKDLYEKQLFSLV